MFLRCPLERPAEVIDEDRRLLELSNQRLQRRRIARLEMNLNRQPEVRGGFPERPQFRLPERR